MTDTKTDKIIVANTCYNYASSRRKKVVA